MTFPVILLVLVSAALSTMLGATNINSPPYLSLADILISTPLKVIIA